MILDGEESPHTVQSRNQVLLGLNLNGRFGLDYGPGGLEFGTGGKVQACTSGP